MESFNKIEQPSKPVKEGGLEAGIEKLRNEINTITSMIDQIEHLQKVPHGYTNLGEKVDSRELPALDQFVEYRDGYEKMQKDTEEAISLAYQALMKQLSLLRDHTGISTLEETLKFDPKTGRQPKDL